MLYLLDKDVRTVRWNGEPLHEATSAIVKETMNGDFTLTVKYPISDSGIYQLIQEDMLIKSPTPVLGAQLFRIKKPVEHNDHLEITAYHISDDVMQRSITPVSVTSQSCGMALSRMVQNTKTALGDFSFNSDIQDRRTFNTTETETLYSVLLDGKHSIVGTWEGELVRDNFAMTVKKSRGENRGVVITTHKNLKDYQRTKNSQNVVTRIHAKSTFKPEGADKETTIRVTVDSPLINSYPYINEKEYENNNAKSVEELRKWAQAKFTNEGIDKVSDAIKIEAYELDGQVVHMGDTANLKSWKHNVDAFKKAIAYEFDALKEEYISLTFDDKAGTGGSRASGGLSSAADAILGVTESAQEIALEKALQNADLYFDHQAGLLRQEIADGIELTKAKAEEVKRELSDTIDQRFSSFDNGPLQDAKRMAEEALRNAGASTLLAQEAKRIGLDSIARLEEVKRQATSTQSALSWDLDTLKRTVTSEANQSSEHRRTTTEALSRMTGQMNGFATKSEVKQDIDGLTQTFAKMRVGGVNLLRNTASLLIGDRSKGYWMSSSGGNGRAISVEVLDPPKNMIKNMIRIIGNTNGGNKDLAQIVRLLIGEKYTISCYARVASDSSNANVNLLFRSWANDTDLNQKFQKSISHKNWEKYSFTFTANAIENSIQFGQSGAGIIEICAPKIESGTLATDWSPALEDTEGIITEAKATFERTAQGLRTDLSAIQEYINKDGQRQEALQRYTREESAKQATAVRELVARDYVGKATYQEDVRGLERRFEAITNPKNGTIATQIANYKQSVDGRFTEITSLLSGKANQTDFQRVKETAQLYERILGNTDNGIADNVARMALTNQLFQVEVGKYSVSGPNLIKNSDFKNGTNEWTSTQNFGRLVKHGFYHNSQKDLMRLSNSTQSDIFLNSPRFELERNTDYVLNFRGFNNGALVSYDVFILGRKAGETSDFSIAKKVIDSKKLSTSRCEDVSITFNSGEMDNAYIRFDNNGSSSGTADLYITEVDLYKGYKPRPWQPAPEDVVADANAKLETIRTQMTLLQGSWAVQNLTSAGAIVSQINATNNQILIEAEKIRLKGKTLLDELTAIQGYFKRLFVGEGTFATLNADVIRTNSITADKLVMDMAMARRFVSSDLFTDTLAAKEAFINKLRSVVVTATLLEGYRGRIGGFQIGTHDNDPSSFWLTGLDQFKVGMSNGRGREFQTAFWANWGNTWGRPGPLSWYVTLDGQMYCNNNATFHRVVDFSSTCSVNFYGANSFYKDIYMRNGSEIYGTGSTPRAGGKNSVVWWNQVGDGSVKYHIDRASDKRLKENIVDSNIVALDKIKQLKMKSFDFISNGKHEEVGLIAQEVEAILPSVISKNPEKADDYLHIDYVAIVPYLIKSIQELNQKIEEMEKTVA